MKDFVQMFDDRAYLAYDTSEVKLRSEVPTDSKPGRYVSLNWEIPILSKAFSVLLISAGPIDKTGVWLTYIADEVQFTDLIVLAYSPAVDVGPLDRKFTGNGRKESYRRIGYGEDTRPAPGGDPRKLQELKGVYSPENLRRFVWRKTLHEYEINPATGHPVHSVDRRDEDEPSETAGVIAPVVSSHSPAVVTAEEIRGFSPSWDVDEVLYRGRWYKLHKVVGSQAYVTLLAPRTDPNLAPLSRWIETRLIRFSRIVRGFSPGKEKLG